MTIISHRLYYYFVKILHLARPSNGAVTPFSYVWWLLTMSWGEEVNLQMNSEIRLVMLTAL